MMSRPVVSGWLLVSAGLLALQSVGPASAQSALDQAMGRLLQAAGPVKGQTLGVGSFRERNTKAVCEPLSNTIRDRVAAAADRVGRQFRRTGFQYAGEVNYIVWGEWTRSQRTALSLELRLVMPTADSMGGQQVSVDTYRLDIADLPETVSRCLVTMVPMDQRLRLRDTITVYDAPDSNGTQVAVLAPGEEIQVTGAVREANWIIVRLADDGRMPTGMRERRGFVRQAAAEDGTLRDARLDRLRTPFLLAVQAEANSGDITAIQAEQIMSSVQAPLTKIGIRTVQLSGFASAQGIIEAARAQGLQGAVILKVTPVSAAPAGDITTAVVRLSAQAYGTRDGSVFAAAEGTGRSMGAGNSVSVAAATKVGGDVGSALAERMLAGAKN